MAYFGLRIPYMNYEITVKLHGPLEEFVVDPRILRTFINTQILDSAAKESFDMARFCNKLAISCAERYCNGDTTVWAEVEIKSNTGLIYSSSAEKVLSNV